MNKIIAYCGIVCTKCSAHVARQADDWAALEEVAAKWREKLNMPDLTANSLICDGCLGGDDARLSGYCSVCEIRACGVEQGVTNCAHCADYACEKLEGFLAHAPWAREVLDGIRRSL